MALDAKAATRTAEFLGSERSGLAANLSELQADELATALGIVSTTLGAAKDALAREYVSLATHTRAPSLDLSALFAGVQQA